LELGRQEIMIPESCVWIFSGDGGRFPGGAFTSRKAAEEWIALRKLTGVLTAYPVDEGCFDWALRHDLITGKAKDRGNDPAFVGAFSSASQDHFHYTDGRSA
jgi:hypothetical protein